jgi:hypothetical protein
MTQLALEQLTQVLGGYLHEDWRCEFESDVSALRAAVASEPREKIALAISEIDELLNKSVTEVVLRDLLMGRVGCYFDPDSEGLNYGQWLRRARGVLASER